MSETIDLGRREDFRLGAALVRPSACEIEGPGGRQSLEPRVMQVLVALAEAAGAVVTREKLVEICWDGRIVSEDAINRVVLRVRRAARGPAAGSFELQTIPKIGFRLRAVQPAGVDGPATPQGGAANRIAPAARKRWLAVGLVAALLAGGLVAIGLATRQPAGPRQTRTALSPMVQDLAIRGSAAVLDGSPQQRAQGVTYFRAAARQSPGVAELWGSLSMAMTLNQTDLPPPQQAEAARRIREAAERALQLDPQETHGWAALTALTPTFGHWTAKEGLVAQAMAHSRRNGPPTLRQKMLFLAATGRTHEARLLAQQLYQVHALASFLNADDLRRLMADGRLEEADAVAARAAQLWPHDNNLWLARFDLALLEGHFDEAREMAGEARNWPSQARPSDMAARGLVAAAMASGRRADADAALSAYERLQSDGQGYLEEAIVAAAGLGRPDRAFQWADRLYGADAPAERYRFVDHTEYAVGGERATDLLFGPFGQRLWGDPRFTTLMQRIGLVGFWSGRAPPDLCAAAKLRVACPAK